MRNRYRGRRDVERALTRFRLIFNPQKCILHVPSPWQGLVKSDESRILSSLACILPLMPREEQLLCRLCFFLDANQAAWSRHRPSSHVSHKRKVKKNETLKNGQADSRNVGNGSSSHVRHPKSLHSSLTPASASPSGHYLGFAFSPPDFSLLLNSWPMGGSELIALRPGERDQRFETR